MINKTAVGGIVVGIILIIVAAVASTDYVVVCVLSGVFGVVLFGFGIGMLYQDDLR